MIYGAQSHELNTTFISSHASLQIRESVFISMGQSGGGSSFGALAMNKYFLEFPDVSVTLQTSTRSAIAALVS